FTHAPLRDEPVQHVRILLRERLGDCGRIAAEHEHRAVGRVGEGAAEQQIAALVRLPGHLEMDVPELSAPLEVIRSGVVEQKKVLHRLPFLSAVISNRPSSTTLFCARTTGSSGSLRTWSSSERRPTIIPSM